LGGFESAIFYPFNLLFLFLPFALASNLVIFFHVLMAGLFTQGWAASRGLKPEACLLAAFGVAWGGPFFLQIYAGHLSNLCAMAWVPLIFWALERLTQKSSLGWALVLALAVGLQGLAGHPQYFYYTALIGAAWAGAAAIGQPRPLPRWGIAAAAYGFGFLLFAAQWLPGLEAVGESARGDLNDFKTAGLFFLPPENFLTLVAPFFFGPLGDNHYWGRWYLWDVCLFTGLGTLFFAALDLWAHRLKRAPEAALIALSALLALGQTTPLFHFLFDWAPGFKSFRGTCKFDFFIVVFIAVMAASGFDWLLRRGKAPSGARLFLAGAAFLSGSAAAAIWFLSQKGLAGGWGLWLLALHWLKEPFAGLEPGVLDSFVRQAGLQSALSLGLLAAAALGLAGGAWAAVRTRQGLYLMGAVALLELGVFAAFHRPTFAQGPWQQRQEALRDFYAAHPGDYRVLGTGSEAALEGGRDLWEQEPLILSRYGHFVARSQGFPENEIFRTSPVFKKIPPLYALTRVKYVFETDGAGALHAMVLPFQPLTRLALFHQAVVVPDEERALGILLEPKFDFRRRVVLEKPPPFPLAAPRGPESFWVQDLSVNEALLGVDLSAPGVLLMTDNFSLGWKVQEAGKAGGALELEPGDGFLKALVLPAGPHRLKLTYAPDSFRVGLWISLVSSFFYIAILACLFRRSPFPTPRRK